MKARSKLQAISKLLNTAGIESPDKEAEIILRTALNINVIDIYRDDPELTEKQMSLLESVVNRRSSREPLQYIIGYVEFIGLRIQVGKGVLIPRPETELMAELAIKKVGAIRGQPVTHHPSPVKILDLCTGSGCLALALAKEFPDAQVYGSDISEIALGYARQNADLNGINNVTFLQENLFEPFTSSLHHFSHFFDLIISNPPYIKSDDIKNLQTEIKDWEPLSALDGGTDGLDFYRAIILIAGKSLKENGILMLEIGIDCADTVKDILKVSGYSHIELTKDYAGIDRIAVGEWSGKSPAA